MKRIFFAICIFMLTGCAANGPAFSPVKSAEKNSGLLYFYRENQFRAGGRTAYFYVNDVNVFDLDRNGYSWITLPAGTYRLKQKWPVDITTKAIEGDIEVRAGETQYFSFRVGSCRNPDHWESGRCFGWELRKEQEATGMTDIEDKKFQENFGLAILKQKLSK
ncbi:DUF2846 domain-containing protein [Undibacterium sp. TJN25]|uniref:DUF2846 domain-containing protein n=1 Tax=Undibacterium sp. TJN25 TaxID=3413056 RepID=UPI003BF3787E